MTATSASGATTPPRMSSAWCGSIKVEHSLAKLGAHGSGEVGTGYFDAVTVVISAGKSSTTTMEGSTEAG